MANLRHMLSEQHSRGAGAQFAGHRPNYSHLYQQVHPIVQSILEVVFSNESEESTNAVTDYILAFRYENGADISHYMNPKEYSDEAMKARMLEAVCHWVRVKTKELDDKVPDYPAIFSIRPDGHPEERATAVRHRLEQALYQQRQPDALVEFIGGIFVELLGREATCLGDCVGAMVLQSVDRSQVWTQAVFMSDRPSTLLALLVRKLEEIQAKLGKVVMEAYRDNGLMSYDDAKNVLMMFFQHYTVDTSTGMLDVHRSGDEEAVQAASFRVRLIDSFGSLMVLLDHIEELISGVNGAKAALAVDFEGVKLCRHGALCLVQMTCTDDPRLVYVLDVHLLGKRAFSLHTAQGTNLKDVLEEQGILKVWFDPRNDVDALFHQFGIMPRGIFDLQLAEVADRRNRGLNVNYVQGLYKCLTQCPQLQAPQKVFAQRINDLGKGLFEPQNGGNYEIFQKRPLNAIILVYAAHDSRYMLMLYEWYLQAIGPKWVPRVLRAGDQRAQWCLQREYVVPSSDAPEI